MLPIKIPIVEVVLDAMYVLSVALKKSTWRRCRRPRRRHCRLAFLRHPRRRAMGANTLLSQRNGFIGLMSAAKPFSFHLLSYSIWHEHHLSDTLATAGGNVLSMLVRT